MKKLSFLTVILLSLLSAKAQTVIINDKLKIVPISDHVLIHISVLHSEQFGRVEANGLIYVNNGEAVIMDTPPTNKQSKELFDWLTDRYKNVKVKAVIVNHFHSDCLGGLRFFHNKGIESWSHKLGPELLAMKKDTFAVPQKTFTESTTITVGGKKVESFYFGEAHTRDNIVTWIADEKVLFGGCMVKSMNAGKGNLADANVKEWSNTIERVAHKFQNVQVVVPGHGDHGGIELLEFTSRLFREN